MAATTVLTAQNVNGRTNDNNIVHGEQFVDSNNDGVCDNYAIGQGNGNGSGICDGSGRVANGQGRGKGNHNGNGDNRGNGAGNSANFADADNNGVCDTYEAR